MANRCLEWLGAHGGMQEGHCLVVDTERTRLVHLVSHGTPLGAPDGFVVDLEARDHPLIRALSGSRPVVLKAGADLPFPRRAPLLAVPLHGTAPGTMRPQVCC